MTEAPIALVGLELIESGVERPEEVVMGARRLKEAAMAGAGKPASLSSPVFLLLSAFLSLLTSSAFRQAFFLVFNKCF